MADRTQHLPNHDMLSAYVDSVLSPDAARSMAHHLGTCEVCRAALEAERGFVRGLDSLARVEPPRDFVNAVMGRVAQYPAHRPAAPVPWRSLMTWGVAASLTVVVLGVLGVAWLVGGDGLPAAEPAGLMATGVARLAGLLAGGIAMLRQLTSPAMVLLEEAGKMLWRVGSLATGSGWLVQATLLLLTVSLNYAFTRLVVNYQRRH